MEQSQNMVIFCVLTPDVSQVAASESNRRQPESRGATAELFWLLLAGCGLPNTLAAVKWISLGCQQSEIKITRA